MDSVVPMSGRANLVLLGAGLDLGALYESALPRLRRIAAGLGLAVADAEDALQDSYVALLGNRDRFRGAGDPDAPVRWLMRVMVNRCLLHHRQSGRRGRLAAAWPVRPAAQPAASGEAGALDEEVKELVHGCLRELPEDESAVLALRYFCEFNATEIGELLSIPPATVRSRLRTARLKLAERLIAKGVVNDVE